MQREVTRPRVLVIDDEELLLECIEEMIGREMQVVKTQDGRDALNLILTELFHLVIADMFLPGMTGLEVMSASRQAGRNIPFVFLSGSCDPEQTELAKAMGAFAFIQKPFDRKFLKATVARALQASGVTITGSSGHPSSD